MMSTIEAPPATLIETPPASLESDMSAADHRPVHVPVLLDQVREVMAPALRSWLLDLTVGAAGHAADLLQASKELRLLGIDQDARILALARERLRGFGERVRLECANFDRVGEICARMGLSGVDGALIDLGVSSLQLDDPERGFSFVQDGPLDMRM
ncbi:MAG: 16S rRNA (cytosine(1402)-N(4))-methyltransferase, partial [Planctomycetota bacterium]